MSTESIRVRQGENFDVTLREPPATGHRWRLAGTPAGVTVIDERYDAPGTGAAPGNAGTKTITLRTTTKGRWRIRFVLARPWDSQPAAEHLVDVDVA
jgi:predicted secreted protein